MFIPIPLQPLEAQVLKGTSTDPLGSNPKLPVKRRHTETLVANQPLPAAERESGCSFHESRTELSPFFKISRVPSQCVLEMEEQRDQSQCSSKFHPQTRNKVFIPVDVISHGVGWLPGNRTCERGGVGRAHHCPHDIARTGTWSGNPRFWLLVLLLDFGPAVSIPAGGSG